MEHDVLGEVRGTKDHPTDRGIHALTRDFSTLTREKFHESSRPDPHETRISRVNRIVTGRVGSGRVGSGRVGSGWVKTCRNSRGSGRVGSRRLENFTGRPTRPDPRDLTRPVKTPEFFYSQELIITYMSLSQHLKQRIFFFRAHRKVLRYPLSPVSALWFTASVPSFP